MILMMILMILMTMTMTMIRQSMYPLFRLQNLSTLDLQVSWRIEYPELKPSKPPQNCVRVDLDATKGKTTNRSSDFSDASAEHMSGDMVAETGLWVDRHKRGHAIYNMAIFS